MGMRTLAATLALTGALGLSGAASASLIDRGGGLVYDTVLDITWLQDASFGGNREWDDAVMWADTLVFEGFDDWRLPSISRAGGLPTGSTATPVDCAIAPEPACRDNELGYMYYHNLTPAGDTPPTNSSTNLTGDQGLIENIQRVHWSGTAFTTDPLDAWDFTFSNGGQAFDNKLNTLAAWAVRPGDVLTVPEPSMAWLLAAGLVGLGLSRRQRRSRPG